MAELSVIKFAELVGVSRVYINQLIQEGMLVRENSKLDTSDRINAQFLKDRKVTQAKIDRLLKKKPKARRKKTIKRKSKPKVEQSCKQVNSVSDKKITIRASAKAKDTKDTDSSVENIDIVPNEEPIKEIVTKSTARKKHDTSAMPDIEDVLKNLEKIDIRDWSTADVGKVQKMESALKTRVDRMQRRGELIDRSVVQTVFGRLYTIDSNELRTLGSKLAPKLASVFGDDDPDKLLAAEKIIDNETLRTLAHIKKVLNTFLKKAGAKQVQ